MKEANTNFHHAGGEDLYSRADNAFSEYRRKWNEWPQEFHVGGFPLFIDIEVTSRCNLKCPFCDTTVNASSIKPGFITFEMVKKIIDEGAASGLYGVKFNMRGEPLLHPQIADFVKYAKEKGLIDVYFNSNAMLLSERISEDLIEAGLDRISISAEGYTKDVYERHRRGARFETVLSNVKRLQEIKLRLNVSRPKVRVQTVMLPELEDIFEDYRAFWGEIADEVAYLDFQDMSQRKKGLAYPWACPQIWQRMAVLWDGTILPCNHDYQQILVLGNARDMAIKDAWHSEKLEHVRRLHKSGDSVKAPVCDGCFLRDSEIRKVIKER